MKKREKRWYRNRKLAIMAAAKMLAGTEPAKERLWAYTVFFDHYMDVGANGTMKRFGPKKAKVLKLVKP